MKKRKFEIIDGPLDLATGKTNWISCFRGEVQTSGWLHYKLRDGTIGLTPPHKWREVKQNKTPNHVQK